MCHRFVTLSVKNFDLNSLKTGRKDWAEMFFAPQDRFETCFKTPV